MIKLTPRDHQSKMLTATTPVIAVFLTMVFGGILFWILGKNPFEAIKLILNLEPNLIGRLLIYDGLQHTAEVIEL